MIWTLFRGKVRNPLRISFVFGSKDDTKKSFWNQLTSTVKLARPHVRSYTLVVYPWELATTSRKQTYACKHEIHQFYLVLNALNKQVINFTHRNLLNLNQLLSVKLYVWDQKIFCLLSRNFKNHLTLVFNVQKGTWLGIYAKY